MSESSFNGTDLLKVFNDLDINLGDVNSNVIHAWFDTDCRKTRNLLNWMCSSLTTENCLTPQEALEWSQIQSPLNGAELEKSFQEIEEEHPYILDYETNRFDNEILKDELEIVETAKKHYDWELKINMNINQNLLAKVANLENKLDRVVNAKKDMEEKCLEASRNLDESHEKLYKQISLFINNYTLETDQFLHNFNIDIIENHYQETIDSVYNLCNDGNLVEFDNNSEDIQNLFDISKRILGSKLKLLYNEMIKSSLNDVVIDCNQFKTIDEEILKFHINKKENLKEILLKDIEHLLHKDIENLLLQPKLLVAKNNLTTVQTRNQQLEKIEQILDKILMYFVEISMLYKLDNKNIEDMEELFTNIWNYINKDLESCGRRIELFENIQETFASFKLNYKPKIVVDMAKIFECDTDNLLEITKKSDSISKQIHQLEKKLFVERLELWKNSAQTSLSEIKALKQSIFSGPTSRIEIIPLPLQIVFNQIDSNRKRREDALAITIKDYKEVSTLLSDKDGQNRRQLWVHFLENPQKLSIIIQQQNQ